MAKDSDEEVGAVFSESWRKIHAVVVRIPRGKVMTYGQVAVAAGLPGAARLVGYAMRGLGGRVPWHRVLGQRRYGIAQISIKEALTGTEQRLRLEREGVRFSPSGGVDLERHGHRPTRLRATAKMRPRAASTAKKRGN